MVSFLRLDGFVPNKFYWRFFTKILHAYHGNRNVKDEEREVCPALPQEGTGASLCSLEPMPIICMIASLCAHNMEACHTTLRLASQRFMVFTSRLLLNVFVVSHLERLCCLEGLV